MATEAKLAKLGRRIRAKSKPVQTRLIQNYAVSVVTASAAGLVAAGDNGAAAAFIDVGGTNVPAPYLASYTPVVGHTVAVDFRNNSPLILGRVIGLPTI